MFQHSNIQNCWNSFLKIKRSKTKFWLQNEAIFPSEKPDCLHTQSHAHHLNMKDLEKFEAILVSFYHPIECFGKSRIEKFTDSEHTGPGILTFLPPGKLGSLVQTGSGSSVLNNHVSESLFLFIIVTLRHPFITLMSTSPISEQ